MGYTLLFLTLYLNINFANSRWPLATVRHTPTTTYDCVYRYFVCTERSGKWPYNKDKCTLLFKRCCEYIENGNHHLDTIHIRPVRPLRPQVEPVNCQWNAWTEGPCSHSCNGGERKKTRTKKVKEKFGGTCEGSSSIVEECNLNRCPEDCTWSSWTVGTCTKTCGGGQRLKNRTLLITEGFGGKCSGQSLSSESCNTNNCPAPELKGIRYKLSAAVNNGTVWVDRNYKFSNLPDYLEGTLLFQIPHKAIRQGTVTEILVHQPSTLYLGHESNRNGGFPKTLPKYGWELVTSNSGIKTGGGDLDYIWKKVVSNDSLTTISLPATKTSETTHCLFVQTGRLTGCEEYKYRNCTNNSAAECNLSGVYSPRKWKKTLNEAKQFCETNTDCRGITRDDNGYEPRRGLDVNNSETAHELWLCKERSKIIIPDINDLPDVPEPIIDENIASDCIWSEWTTEKCSRSCGGGQRTKTRILEPNDGFEGKCSGRNSITESCNTNQCTRKQLGETCGACFSIQTGYECGKCANGLICQPGDPQLPDLPGTCVEDPDLNVIETCLDPYTNIAGLCVYVSSSNEKKNYSDSRDYCNSIKGRLYEPRNKDQFDSLANYLKNNLALKPSTDKDNLWFGVNDILSEGNFVYDSDKGPIIFTKWAANQPDDARGVEDCGHLFHITATGWNDAPCTNSFRFLCEQTIF